MESALFELDDMGILRATKLPTHLAWLEGAQGTLLVQLLAAGEEGMTRRRLKKFEKDGDDEAARRLELRDLVKWEHDRFGAKAFLVLTWKGEEAANVLLKVFKHRKLPFKADGPLA
jgi:hypothetical protein